MTASYVPPRLQPVAYSVKMRTALRYHRIPFVAVPARYENPRHT